MLPKHLWTSTEDSLSRNSPLNQLRKKEEGRFITLALITLFAKLSFNGKRASRQVGPIKQNGRKRIPNKGNHTTVMLVSMRSLTVVIDSPSLDTGRRLRPKSGRSSLTEAQRFPGQRTEALRDQETVRSREIERPALLADRQFETSEMEIRLM